MNKKTLILITGPTAIGKTALSLHLARYFKTEIVSADSRQFYREMNIGTAIPTEEELTAVPHHFIHHKSIFEKYTVGDFEKDALERLEQLFIQNDCVIMVGGSGLYVDAVTQGLDKFPQVDQEIRKNLRIRYEKEGLKDLARELEQRDPEYFSQVDIRNAHRVMRALEICIGTGKAYSSFRTKRKVSRSFDTIHIGLTADRKVIYDRINRRVDLMMDLGLLKEAEHLFDHRNLNALNTVGYKELFRFLEGQLSLEAAIEEIKKNTRRYAKRQLTWFRKNRDISWFDYSEPGREIIDFIESKTAPES